MADNIHIKINKCAVNPSGSVSAGDVFIWKNQGTTQVTIKFDGDVPDLFGEGHAPPDDIPIAGGCHAKKTLDMNLGLGRSIDCRYNIASSDCHEPDSGIRTPGAHVIIVDP